MRIGVVGVIALGMLTAACGSDESQRSATGGLTGIGVGAAVGGPIGAVVGGVAGAAGGAAMPEGADTIAENAVHHERAAGQSKLREAGLAPARGSSQAQAAKEQLRQAQTELQQQGLYKGKVDGIFGPLTKQALGDYQKREGLQQTASLDHATLQRLGLAASPATASGTSTPPASSGTAPAPANAPSAPDAGSSNSSGADNSSGTNDNSSAGANGNAGSHTSGGTTSR